MIYKLKTEKKEKEERFKKGNGESQVYTESQRQ